MLQLLAASSRHSWCLATVLLLAAPSPAGAQLAGGDDVVAAQAAAGAADTGPTLIVGRVLDPHGAPVAGAVVVTSLGGQAATDAAGAFSVELALPPGATGLRVTAVAGSGTASLVGSVQISPARDGATDAGTLVLAQSADCEPSWLPTFGQTPGVIASGVTPGISALAVFDDGNGPALYAAGSFVTAGGVTVNDIARWDGTYWSAVGGGMNGPGASEVYALVVFDDGRGEALYAGGFFFSAGGVAASQIARWDGTSWSALGSGLNKVAYALSVFDDGAGPALNAAGDFSLAGGTPVNRIARWDGTNWSALGGGVNERIWSLAVFEDAHGPVLVAGGIFTSAGGVAASRIAKWNGTSWSALGAGVNGAVWTMSVFDDGGGPALFVGGQFLSAGGVAANRIAKWDMTSWSTLGGGVNATVFGLTTFDDGGGPALYAAGQFTAADGVPCNRIAKWDGSAWSALSGGLGGDTRTLAVFDAGQGPALFAGGNFSAADGLPVQSVASWDGSDWSTLGAGADNWVWSLAVFDDGGGPALYAGGEFKMIGGVVANGIAKWNGSTWSSLGAGVNPQEVWALAVFDDGRGAALYAGGNFFSAGGVTVHSIARWDGTSWSALDSGLSNAVQALAVYDDGGGAALFAGGYFTLASGLPASCIAKWDGASWSALGQGIGGFTSASVFALEVFDDGGGPALYAGGEFSEAGHISASGIAKWNGSGWSALGAGVSGGGFPRVHALEIFDDGGGPALYAGGRFDSAGGVGASNVARWDGSSWSALGDGVGGSPAEDAVWTLASFDDGDGAALYAGGGLTTAGLQPASHVARWDGASWSALDSGVSNLVLALSVFDAGQGPSLFVGGGFGVAFDSQDSFLAQWGGCGGFPDPWTDLGGGLPGFFGLPNLVGTGDLGPGTPGSLQLTNATPERPAMLFISAASTPLPFKCGTLVPVPALVQIPLLTNISGAISLGWSSWPAGLSGFSLYFQYAIKDVVAVCGVSLSNALRADVP
jgi:hypothetical protein